MRFLEGHLPNLTTGLDWDGNVLSPLGPDPLSAKQGERARQYMMRLEAQPMALAGPQELSEWLDEWEQTHQLLLSKRVIAVKPKADSGGVRPDRIIAPIWRGLSRLPL